MTWRTADGQGPDGSLGEELQFGHGFDAVEDGDRVARTARSRGQLQFGHGFDAVEDVQDSPTARHTSARLQFGHGFDAVEDNVPDPEAESKLAASIRPRL